jgi:hypothetical protein
MTPEEKNAARHDLAAQIYTAILVAAHPPLVDVPPAPISADEETPEQAELREAAIAAAGQASRDWYRTMAIYAERSFAAADAFMAEAVLHTGPLDADGIPTDTAALDPLCVHRRKASEDCPLCAEAMRAGGGQPMPTAGNA